MQTFSPAPSFTRILPALLLLSLVFFANFIARTVFGPLLLPISATLHLDLSVTAIVYIFLSGGYSISVLCAGFLSKCIGHKKTIIVCLSVIGISLLCLARVSSFLGLLFWSTVAGLGAGLYMPSGVASITTITPQTFWGHAFAIHELAPNFAFILAPILTQYCVGPENFAPLFLILGSFCLALALGYALYGPVIDRPGLPPKLHILSSLMSTSSFWIITLFFIFAISIEQGVYNLVPAFLTHDHAFTQENANELLSITRVVAMFFLPFTGMISKRLGYPKTLALCLMGTALSTAGAGFGPTWWVILMLTLQPLFAVCFFPVGFAVLALVNPGARNEIAVSLTITWSAVFGAGMLPAALARCGELWGFSTAFILFGLLMAAASLLALSCLNLSEHSQ